MSTYYSGQRKLLKGKSNQIKNLRSRNFFQGTNGMRFLGGSVLNLAFIFQLR